MEVFHRRLNIRLDWHSPPCHTNPYNVCISCGSSCYSSIPNWKSRKNLHKKPVQLHIPAPSTALLLSHKYLVISFKCKLIINNKYRVLVHIFSGLFILVQCTVVFLMPVMYSVYSLWRHSILYMYFYSNCGNCGIV